MTKEQAEKLLMHADSIRTLARQLLRTINESGPIDLETDTDALGSTDAIEFDAAQITKLIESL